MKRFIPILVTAVLFLVVGCNREKDVPTPQSGVKYAKVPVVLAQESDVPGTRSLINIQSENFQKAALFAFGSDGHVLLYQENGGDLESSHPVAIETTEKSFEWALPIETNMDIYVLVNYGSLSALGLSVNDGNLTKNTLDNLMYSCGTISAFTAIDETNMPMTGIVQNKTITSFNDQLDITVKRLFAKYDITFNTDAYHAAGYTLTAGYMKAMNCSASVPYFLPNGGGYKVTVGSNGQPQNVVSSMDELTGAQLASLFNSGSTATLYVLENMQGNLGSASSWDHVYDELGEDVMKCATYLQIRLTAAKDGKTEDFIYRIYLGKTDMKSNFDVQRNFYKKLNVTLKPILPDPDQPENPGASPFNGFVFLPGTYTVSPGQSIDIPFETNLSQGEIDAEVLNSSCLVADDLPVRNFRTNSNGQSRYAYAGTMRFVAASRLSTQAESITVLGGIINDETMRDDALVNVGKTPLEDIVINCYVRSISEHIPEGVGHEINYEGHGNDMNVGVDIDDGNECYVRLGGRVKYNGEWHDIVPSTDPLVQYSVSEGNPTSTSWVAPNSENFSYHEWYMPGNYDVIKYWFNGEVVRTFTIHYN